MPDEYMGDMGPPETGTPSQASSEPAEESPEGATALIPKTLLAGKDFKPGDEVVLRIVHSYEDEVEVEYATETPKEKPTEEEAEPSMDDEIDSLAAGPKGY